MEKNAGIMKDFDQAIAFLGEWGRFQKIVFFSICLSMISNSFGLGIVFVYDTPKHQCFIPPSNLTQEWLQAVIPVSVVNSVEERSRCSRYRLDVVMNLSAQGSAPDDMNLTELQQEPCVDGWSYSKDIYQSTIVTEFDLVCNDQWKRPFTSTIYFIGCFVGSFIFGQVSDRFGRKPVLFTTMALQALFMFFQAFSTSWAMFAVLMLFAGAGNTANFGAAFVAGAEILTGNVRLLFFTLGIGLSYSTGYLLMPLLAFFIRDWKSFQMAISLPILLFLPFWWVIPESPRWLLSQGRVDEAEAIVRKAADMNKVDVPPVVFEEEMTQGLKNEKKKHTVLDLLKTSNIRTTTMILCFLQFSLSVGYFGVTLNTSKLTPDPYLGSCISAMVEFPAYLITWLSIKRSPRTVFISSAMVLGGVCLLLLPAIPPSLRWLSITLEMIGKFCMVGTTNFVFAYTAEVFPTVLRNTAKGVCSTWARIGSCIAPFIIQLRLYFTFLPPIVMGTLAVGSAIGALFLPETVRQPLPETIQDMQHNKRIKFPCLGRQKPTTSIIGHMEAKL